MARWLVHPKAKASCGFPAAVAAAGTAHATTKWRRCRFGASTGAAAAVSAAARQGRGIRAVVCRGGRPDLAPAQDLARVQCPTLLLVGRRDAQVLALNRRAASHLHATKVLTVVPGATHLCEEPGTLETVAGLAADWFAQHLLAARALVSGAQ